MFTGEVDIIGGSLNGYDVGNLGCSYELNATGKLNYILDLKVNNIYNTYYENVALRPMPNRNFNIQLTLKF